MRGNDQLKISKLDLTQHTESVRFGIRGQLLSGFGSIIVILIIIISTTLYFVNDTKYYSTKVVAVDLPTSDEFIDLNSAISSAQIFLEAFLLTGDSKYALKNKLMWEIIKTKTDNINVLQKYWTQVDKVKLWQKIKYRLDSIKQVRDKILNISASNKPAAIELLNSDYLPMINEVDTLMNVQNASDQKEFGILDLQSQVLSQEAQNVMNNLSQFQIIEYVLFAIGSIAAILIALYTLRVIGTITRHINDACHGMAGALEEVRHSIDVQSTGSSQQASSVNEITASLREIETSSSQTMFKAKTLGDFAERTRENGQAGLDAVEQSIEGMKIIKDKVQTIAQTILDLSHQTQQVGEITAVVNNLAQQSKMLALNASIEAAKAGEAGKGFSVVATEVKNLAEQSEQSTKQVQKILQDIRQATEKAVMVTEEGTKGVDQGAVLVEQTGGAIENLNNVIAETAVASQQIVAAVRQEVAGIEQITAGMNEINQVTTAFVDSAMQTKEAINNLTDVAKNLKAYVDIYKV